MLNNKDFSKSNKEYIKRNKFSLIIFALVLLAGLICGLVFGFNGNYEFKGYNEFSVRYSIDKQSKISNLKDDIEDIVNKQGGEVFSVTEVGEGDFTKFVVKYSVDLKAASQTEINNAIAKKLNKENIFGDVVIDETNLAEYISAHNHVGAVVQAKDYVYTATAILIILVLATIFAYFRYDGACAISTILACLFGTALFMSFATILRLTVGLSFFALLVIVNLLIIYCSYAIFENIRETSWLQAKEYSTALSGALKSTRARVLFITFGVAAIGLIFAIVAPANLKYIAVSIMFIAVTLLAIVWYLVPFIWSLLIQRTNIRRFKVKTKSENK